MTPSLLLTIRPDNLARTTSREDVQADARFATNWILGFLLLEIACQLALALSPAMTLTTVLALRVPLRALAFAASIALAFILPRSRDDRARLHPALPAAICVLVIVAIGMIHPQSNALRARLASFAMYAAIIAPLIWIGRLRVDARLLRRIIIVMWAFAALNVIVGTLQTLRPDWQWLQPNLSSIVQGHEDGGDMLKIALASGAIIFRPMGLSDQPGAAAMAGLTTIVFGAALLAHHRKAWMWMLAVFTMTLSMYCILLSQLRSVLLMTGVCVIALLFVMSRAGAWKSVRAVGSAIAGAILFGVASAIFVGGASVTSRLATLSQSDPGEVYYESRGHFLQHTFEQVIPASPLGAGLGRWGMINYYFGSPDDANSAPLYAEIMWTGWAFDGGLPLMLAYGVAIAIAIWQSWKLAMHARDELRLWAALVFAFNIGCLAITFNYPLFMGQAGLEFWLLNAALFAAFQSRQINYRAELAA